MSRHATHDASCGVCSENSGETAMEHGVLWQTEHWMLHHSAAPYGVAGWLTLQARAHTRHAGEFSDGEAASWGPALRAACAALQAASGAARVYTAALGEMHPHFHCHLVPRAEDGVKGWPLFSQQAEAAAGRVVVDAARVAAICAAVKAALAGVVI